MLAELVGVLDATGSPAKSATRRENRRVRGQLWLPVGRVTGKNSQGSCNGVRGLTDRPPRQPARGPGVLAKASFDLAQVARTPGLALELALPVTVRGAPAVLKAIVRAPFLGDLGLGGQGYWYASL